LAENKTINELNEIHYNKEKGFLQVMFLSFGMIGSAIFLIVSLMDGRTRTDYNQSYHMISHLSLGDRAWLGISSSIIVALLILGFAYRLQYVKINGEPSKWGVRLFILLGFGLLLSAIFVMDPMMDYPPSVKTVLTLRGRIHDGSALLIFGSLIAIGFVWSKIFSSDPSLLKWSRYSFISGLVMLISIIICSILFILDLTKVVPGGPVGLFERILLYTGFIWIFSFSYWLVKHRL